MSDASPQSSVARRPVVEMFFDPVCPFAWMTSRWLMEVEKVRDIEVEWHVMSLAVLNEDRELPDGYRQLMNRAWMPARLVTAARSECGQDVVKPLYDAIGRRFHPGGSDARDAETVRRVLSEALAECHLPAELLSRAEHQAGDGVDTALRSSHQRAMDMVGDDVGTPVVAFEGVAFFGPVVSPAPKGEQAGKLWDGCLLVAGTPGFFELKRTRTGGPDFS